MAFGGNRPLRGRRHGGDLSRGLHYGESIHARLDRWATRKFQAPPPQGVVASGRSDEQRGH